MSKSTASLFPRQPDNEKEEGDLKNRFAPGVYIWLFGEYMELNRNAEEKFSSSFAFRVSEEL